MSEFETKVLALLERIAVALEGSSFHPVMNAPMCLHLEKESTTAGSYCKRCGMRLVSLTWGG